MQKALHEEMKELLGVVGPAPLVDLLLERAFQMNATDVHFDPSASGLRVRLRVDGMLLDVVRLPVEMSLQVISRLKLMAEMDITERRLAQDGHFSNAILRQTRDVRVGSGPTVHGERLVLRLMPDISTFTRLDELGFEEPQMQAVNEFLETPYGVILSTGPVGSGKSTTIYACIDKLNELSQCLVTIEDPVERQIAGVNQTQVDPKIEFKFIDALRGVLRQDPDVMMIGEIRDSETARIGIRAGLTGVTVLSTLHASDTASSIDILREFGVPPLFIANSLRGIMSQRLLRVVCEHCKTKYHPDSAECEFLGIDPARANSVELAEEKGCDACFHTGYHGRTGVFEILRVTELVRRAILEEAGHERLRQLARESGMLSLEEMARKKVLSGFTTIKEMHRVLTSFPA